MPILLIQQVRIRQRQRPTDPATPAEYLLNPRPCTFRQYATALGLAYFFADQGFNQADHCMQVFTIGLLQVVARHGNGFSRITKLTQ